MPELNWTGHYGPITAQEVVDCHEDSVIARDLQIMHDYFQEHVKQDPSQEKFLHGWISRIEHTRKIVAPA
jgi:hypothetical protein